MEYNEEKKFHHFTQGTIEEEPKRSKGCGRERWCCGLLILLLIAAVVGVSVYFTQNYTKNSDIPSSGEQQGEKQTTPVSITSTKPTTAAPTTTTMPPTTTTTKATTPKPSMEVLRKRVDCIPEAQSSDSIVKVTRELCDQRGCDFDETGGVGVPVCFFKSDLGYKVTGVRDTELGFQVELEKKVDGPFGDDLEKAVFEVEMHGDDIIRFKFDDPVFNRYKVPLDMNLPKKRPENATYEIHITNNETFSFKIVRRSTGTTLWDTSVGGLVLSNQFLQISTKLPSSNVYGFGENLHRTFRHDLNHKTWPMWARDQAPSHAKEANLYGVHPFYTCMEPGGHSHGVFLLNSNAMDYSFTPLPMLTYRTIGGVLDFYMFLGPEPENVVQQYTAVIGRPFMPPYYALGFQLCRYGYRDTDHMEEAFNRTRKYGIPVDIQYGDIDHFDANKDFTLDETNFGRMPEYFRGLQADGMRTVIILDPALISNDIGYEPYDNLTAVRGAIMWPEDYIVSDEDKDSTGALLGYVWPSGKSVFPDFFKQETQDLWARLIVKHRNKVPFDGLWIDMNEPANFGTNLEKPWNWPDNVEPWSLKCPHNSRLEDPPYRTKAGYVWDDSSTGFVGRLSDKTICMVSKQGQEDKYDHYNVHSLFGWSQAPATLRGAQQATGERSFVLSRSTYPGSGKYAGHWLGDNDSRWSDLRASIIGMLEFNLFGIPYIGADICGYWYNTTPELCKRWQQLGAFYPFSRNHNQHDNQDQDPGALGAEVANATREAMETRYWLLPYLYTLFHKAHTEGTTVVRSLFHEYPQQVELYSVDRQFLWGKSLMIIPILDEGATEVIYQLPPGKWYDFYTGSAMSGPQADVKRTVDQDSNIGLMVRGGSILPMQKPANNTSFSRKNGFKLLAALDENNMAEGDMFWDDGVSKDTYESGNYFLAKFKVERNVLSMSLENENTAELMGMFLEEVQIYGAPPGVQRIYSDGDNINVTYSDSGVLTLKNLQIPFKRNFKIFWSMESEDERMRHDCIPEAQGSGVKVTEELCKQRQCVYNRNASQGPTCYFGQNYGYSMVDSQPTEFGFQYNLMRKTQAGPFNDLGSPDMQNILFIVEMRSNDVLRFKFVAKDQARFEVPVEMKLGSNKATMPRYEVKVTSQNPFAFQVIRKSNGVVLWDTGVGGLTFSEHYLHISTRLPSKHIYGFGENIHHTFRHDLDYRSWPLWSRDQPTSWGDYLNHYGVHPFYMCHEGMESGGFSHGVLLLNSNAQDYSFTPLPMLTYRTIGGVLDFYMFLGPEPENVVQQYTAAIGHPYMPPYWSLGFQLCRYGYNNLSNLIDAVEKTKLADIPHDVQYADIDHMEEQKDFTIDNTQFPGLNAYFKSLQAGGMHTIIILDPALLATDNTYQPFVRMRDTNSSIKWPNADHVPAESIGSNMDLLGYVWPKGPAVFPDFFKNSTHQVWKELITEHHKDTLTFDGLWIDMNEPANFGTNEERPWNTPPTSSIKGLNCSFPGNYYEHPPYRTAAAYAHDSPDKVRMISDKTICMRAVQGDNGEYMHYDVHSLFGWSQTKPTLDALRAATGERGIVISRSTFPSSGKYAGHWLGDNNSVWKDLRRSIIGSLEFNLFGIPYIGADICGFMVDTTPELCKRWMQLGAFYTFSRNHNGINYKRQDPGSLGEDVARASRVAMETRYWLLPYLYTLFHHAHTRGSTVMRPLYHEFADDAMTLDIDQQLLWGPALMISPILYQGQSTINIYVPRGPWYDFYTGVVEGTEGDYVRQSVTPDSDIPLHVRAGHILPMQRPANNTEHSRKNPFTLLVALKDSENGGRGFVANGDLYWDDGDSIDTYEQGHYFYARFTSGHDTLSMSVYHNNQSGIDQLTIGNVLVYGVQKSVEIVYIGDKAHSTLHYNPQTKVLNITGLTIPMKDDFTMEWREYRKPTVEEMERVTCYPEYDNHAITKTQCDARDCIYDNQVILPFIPKCYINSNIYGYNRISDKNGVSLNKKRSHDGLMFGDNIFNLRVEVETHSANILRIKISDSDTLRYEPPVPLDFKNKNVTDAVYRVEMSDEGSPFDIKVVRKSTNATIWDTSAGPLIFSKQYLQISTKLTSEYFYGLGEHRHFHLKHNMDYRTWPIFTRDAAVNSDDYTNLYGAQPFYMNVEDDNGRANAVLFLNTNAMEVVLEPLPRVTYRTIGGILDFYIFLGDSPADVIKQYHQVIGPPVMVPYWSLGFQLCRWGYNSLENLKAAVDRTREAGIPHDIQYGDIDHFDERKDFTIDAVNFAGFAEYIDSLRAGGMRFVPIVDPAIISNETDYWPYDTGVERDAFIKWPSNVGPLDARPPNSSIMLGYVWPKGKTAFPDFLKNETREWWSETLARYQDLIKYDGLWIDMNEPANFDTNGERPWNWPEKDKPYWSLKCTLDNNTYDVPPYKPKSVLGELLSEKTLCMVGEQADGTYKHYDVHSLYGWSMTEPTVRGVHNATGKRGMVVSRSTYPSSGRHGSHWLGDNDSFWRNLHDSIIGIIEFSMFGIAHVGADICGFFSEPSEEMCQRWMQLGAFYTFSRNHNGLNMKIQDPGSFSAQMSYSSAQVMNIRYSLLPYVYTQFFHVNQEGGTVIRSMLQEFPTDKRTWTIDTQFMWGQALLIAPVLEQGHRYKDVYLPDARWFDHHTGSEMKDRHTMVTVEAPRDVIPLFWKGGHIIPTQKPANNTVFSRRNTLGLMVFPGDDGLATGDLFWDDGESIDTIENKEFFYATFQSNPTSLSMYIQKINAAVAGLNFDEFKVFGVETEPKSVAAGSASHTYYKDSKMLHIQNKNGIPLANNFTISWTL